MDIWNRREHCAQTSSIFNTAALLWTTCDACTDIHIILWLRKGMGSWLSSLAVLKISNHLVTLFFNIKKIIWKIGYPSTLGDAWFESYPQPTSKTLFPPMSLLTFNYRQCWVTWNFIFFLLFFWNDDKRSKAKWVQ